MTCLLPASPWRARQVVRAKAARAQESRLFRNKLSCPVRAQLNWRLDHEFTTVGGDVEVANLEVWSERGHVFAEMGDNEHRASASDDWRPRAET
jgi:hypothetical protein